MERASVVTMAVAAKKEPSVTWAPREPRNTSELDNAFQKANAETEELLKDRKLFVGNLSWKTTEEGLVNHFSKFGPCEATVVLDKNTGNSRSFGFVTFFSKECAEGSIDGRQRAKEEAAAKDVEARFREVYLAAKPEQKMLVSGLAPNTTTNSLAASFSSFGACDCAVMQDDSGRSRGYGYVLFSQPDQMQAVFNRHMNGVATIIDGWQVSCRPADDQQPDFVDTEFSPSQGASHHVEYRDQFDSFTTQDWELWKGEQKTMMMQKLWPLFQKRKHLLKQRLLNAMAQGAGGNLAGNVVSPVPSGASLGVGGTGIAGHMTSWGPIDAVGKGSWGPY